MQRLSDIRLNKYRDPSSSTAVEIHGNVNKNISLASGVSHTGYGSLIVEESKVCFIGYCIFTLSVLFPTRCILSTKMYEEVHYIRRIVIYAIQ